MFERTVEGKGHHVDIHVLPRRGRGVPVAVKGANGEIIAVGEGHTRRADAVRAAENFKANVGKARVLRPAVARARPGVVAQPTGRSLLAALLEQNSRG